MRERTTPKYDAAQRWEYVTLLAAAMSRGDMPADEAARDADAAMEEVGKRFGAQGDEGGDHV